MSDVLTLIEDSGYNTDGFENTIEFDEYRDALIGFTDDYRLVYDYDAIVKILMNRDNMTSDEAAEFIDHNVAGFRISGVNAPIIIYRIYT